MRMTQLNILLGNENLSFFEIIRENFHDKVLFDLNYPLESIFLYNALQESNLDETGTVVKDMISEVLKFIASLVRKYQQRGELNPGISPEIAAHFIFQTQLGIYDYLAKFKGIDFKKVLKMVGFFRFQKKKL